MHENAGFFPSVSFIFAIVPIDEWQRTLINPVRFRPSKEGLVQEVSRLMSSDEKVLDFPRVEVTSEENARRVMVEATRLARLAPSRAEHPNTQERAREDVMFGCSDVYHSAV